MRIYCRKHPIGYYVYQYSHPLTSSPFYIGKGKGPRYLKHLDETKDNTENYKKWAVIQGLRNKGLEPIITIIEQGLTEDAAYNLESSLIIKYGRRGIDDGGILTNLCIDQKPPHNPWTEERREAARIRGRNRIITDEMREKCRQANLGRVTIEATRVLQSIAAKKRMQEKGNPMSGKKHREDTLQKLRDKARDRGPIPKIECVHCGKVSDPGNHKKHHGNRCKQNPDNQYQKPQLEIVSCPHCNKVGQQLGGMLRWHFDNCKSSPKSA